MRGTLSKSEECIRACSAPVVAGIRHGNLPGGLNRALEGAHLKKESIVTHRIAKLGIAKLAAGAALVCLPLQVYAQALDLTPYPQRVLSDPNFLPLAGQFYGTTAYSHGWVSGNSDNYLGDQTSSFHVNTNTLEQLLAFGITDDLMVDASIQYAPENYRETDYASGQSTTIDSSGFNDPTFGATWRVLDQAAAPVNFDLLGSYTPDWIDAHTATAVEDGTVARGGQSGTLGAALGYETRSFGIRGGFTANFLGDSSVYNLANGDIVDTDAHTDYAVSLATQTRLTDLFSVNAGIDHTFASNTSGLNISNGLQHWSEPGDETALNLALNYDFVPNAFVISATYAHDFYDDARTYYANPTFDNETRDRGGDLLGVKLYYATP